MKWCSDNAKLCHEAIQNNIVDIMSLFPDVINSQESMDDSVLNFTNTLNDVIEPFCNHVEKVNRYSSYSPNTRSTCYDNNVYDKPWFNDDVKICYSNYKKALRDFNNCKSFSKHRDLTQEDLQSERTQM